MMLHPAPTDTPDAAMLFEVYYDRIYRYILGLMRNAAEAEDLTQETFVRAYVRRDSLRDAGALTAWLYRIATHICLDRLRERARRAPLEMEVDPDDFDLPDSEAPSVQKTSEQNEMSACVQQYVADLPDDYRVALLLHDVHGLTVAEIAGVLDVTLSNAKIRLHRARRRLQAALEGGCAFSHDERDVLVCEPKS